jgi:hypothetical protein
VQKEGKEKKRKENGATINITVLRLPLDKKKKNNKTLCRMMKCMNVEQFL